MSASPHRRYAVAVAIDVAQLLFGPFGWAGFDEILDAIAMVVVSRLVGFHPLLLPTFVLEFVPFTDMLPTWTGCVALVVRIRKRDGLVSDDAAPAIDVSGKSGIDVHAKRLPGCTFWHLPHCDLTMSSSSAACRKSRGSSEL